MRLGPRLRTGPTAGSYSRLGQAVGGGAEVPLTPLRCLGRTAATRPWREPAAPCPPA